MTPEEIRGTIIPPPPPGSEPLTAKWEKQILTMFIERHGVENVRHALTLLAGQLQTNLGGA